MNLIEDEDAIASLSRSVLNVLDEPANVIDAPIRRPVHLGHIRVFTPKDPFTGGTLAAWDRILGMRALKSRSKDPRHRGLTNSPGPTEEICMGQSILQNRLLQGISDRFLTHHFIEVPWSEATGNHLVFVGIFSGSILTGPVIRGLGTHGPIRTRGPHSGKALKQFKSAQFDKEERFRLWNSGAEIGGQKSVKMRWRRKTRREDWEEDETGARSTPADTVMAAPVRA